MNDFWLWRILWVLVFFHVAVTDVHYHAGSGLCSCVQLVFLSWKQRKAVASKDGNLSRNTAPGTAGLQSTPHLGRELSVCCSKTQVSSSTAGLCQLPQPILGVLLDHRSVRHHKIHTTSCLGWGLAPISAADSTEINPQSRQRRKNTGGPG